MFSVEANETRAKCYALEKELSEKLALLEQVKAEKDDEVEFYLFSLTQIKNAKITYRDLEVQISSLKETITSIEADSRKALEQALEESHLKAYFLRFTANIRL
jgi:hypothetical protein